MGGRADCVGGVGGLGWALLGACEGQEGPGG